MSGVDIIPEYVLFCDLVRREDTGKRLFVGVYTQGLAVEAFPQTVSFSAYLHGRFEGSGAHTVEILVRTLRSKLELFRAQAEAGDDFEITPTLKFELPVPTLSFPVEQEETVIVEIKCNNDTWKEFGRLEITLLDPKFSI